MMLVAILSPWQIESPEAYRWACMEESIVFHKEQPFEYEHITWKEVTQFIEKLVIYVDYGITDDMFKVAQEFLKLHRTVQFRKLTTNYQMNLADER